MERTFKIYNNQYKVTVEITDEKKDRIIDSILKWCEKHDCTCGEKLSQNDDCLIDAPDLLCDIIDNILQFKTSE